MFLKTLALQLIPCSTIAVSHNSHHHQLEVSRLRMAEPVTMVYKMNQKQYTPATVGSDYKVLRSEDVRGMVFGVKQHQCVKLTVRFVISFIVPDLCARL